jgi:hypothetical protein
MEWQFIVALVVMIPIVLVPVALGPRQPQGQWPAVSMAGWCGAAKDIDGRPLTRLFVTVFDHG